MLEPSQRFVKLFVLLGKDTKVTSQDDVQGSAAPRSAANG